ncbi:hypothetical protein LEMLEM_LOCUS20361, partial [Lemmus lemmus]
TVWCNHNSDLAREGAASWGSAGRPKLLPTGLAPPLPLGGRQGRVSPRTCPSCRPCTAVERKLTSSLQSSCLRCQLLGPQARSPRPCPLRSSPTPAANATYGKTHAQRWSTGFARRHPEKLGVSVLRPGEGRTQESSSTGETQGMRPHARALHRPTELRNSRRPHPPFLAMRDFLHSATYRRLCAGCRFLRWFCNVEACRVVLGSSLGGI